MTISHSPLAYEDCYAVLDKALADPQGVRVLMRDWNAAYFFRMRCHNARKIDRKKNKEIYEDKAHPLHGCSEYDRLIIRIRVDEDGDYWLFIEQIAVAPGDVFSLTSDERVDLALPQIEHAAKRMLPPPKEDIAAALPDLDLDKTDTVHHGEIIPPLAGFRRPQ